MSIPNPQQVEAIEQGGRQLKGRLATLLLATALGWSLFQLWIASPLPYWLGFGLFNASESRAIHLAFALFLGYLAFPARRGALTARLPLYDGLLAVAAVACTLYLLVFYQELARRAGNPTTLDVVVAILGLLLLLEATRRTLGWPLTLIAIAFLGYTFGGPWLPDVLAHRGASLERVASHQWLTGEGVFGVAIGVSASFVFLFVLFGAMLERAGGGHYFIRVAFALVGHLRGGPAKAGILASGLTGMVSGSSIANVVTTGTFTIPLMKKAGFPAYRAGAIEVAASTNGQLMPPVMGAAAFLMVEYVNIPYTEVLKHALLPALLSYLALLYVIHLEALKAGMEPGRRAAVAALPRRLLGWGLTLAGVVIFSAAVWLLLAGVAALFGGWAGYVAALLLLLGYVALIALEADTPEPEGWDPERPLTPAEALRGGLHFLLPVAVLVWCLIIVRLSPAASVFNAILLLIVIQLTQHPLRRLFRHQAVGSAWRRGLHELVAALEGGARNMVPIAIATASAGIVVGTVSLTGIGQLLGELIELASFGSFTLMLLLVALICMILGMGLPTTANYIVVATLMAPVMVQIGAANGLEIPLIAAHLFVFYFGILADDTPPVGLAAYAAAGIANADPIQTGLQSFFYDLRTAILPFIFIFNTDLLLIGIEGVGHLLLVILSGLLAMLLFAAATQGWLLTRSRWWESLLLLLIAVALFRLDLPRDQLYPAYHQHSGAELVSAIATMPPGQPLHLQVESEEERGTTLRTLVFTLPDRPAEQRLQQLGLITRLHQGELLIDDIGLFSPAEDLGLLPGYATRIVGYQLPAEQPSKYWFMIPPLLLLAGVLFAQQRRREAETPRSPAL